MHASLSYARFAFGAVLLVALLATLVIAPHFASAQGNFGNTVGGSVNNVGRSTVLSDTDLESAIGKMINTFLGILGIVAVIIVIYGGFLWMTASGNTEQVEKAQTLLIQGLIGFVIIALAWSIARFVVSRIAGSL